MREKIVQPANSSENLSADRGKLASCIVTQLSLTATLTSQYFPGVLFLTKYQGFL